MVCILITAGPTREYLDDVRFLSNGSSGRMGCALAAAGAAAGHNIRMVLGPVEVAPPVGVTVRPVVSALEMQAAAEEWFATSDVVIAAAAVADYRPAVRQTGKPARSGGSFSLELVPNPDIVAGLAARKGRRVVVGFALEASDAGLDAALRRGASKLRQKQLDLVVVNLSSAIGGTESEVVLLFADGSQLQLPRQGKTVTAARIVDAAVDLWQQRQAAKGCAT